PQNALDPQLLRMFLDEARLMARLSHPNIPQVSAVDDGAEGAIPYFVMEYVHGTDLRGVLNAAGPGPLPLEQALQIAAAVAAGLHHAHEHRGSAGQSLEIVHRDISPSNVLINFDGGVKITDFGVAKWSEQKSFTHQGQLKGKFAHMSPEQCRGEPLDRRSDVFALGTLLYEMTTGQPAFAADSEYELLRQIVSRDAPAPRIPDAVFPAQLEEIVMKSLRRDRADRYATAQHLQLDLEAFAREHRLVVSPVALAGYVETLFGAQVTQWRQAMASGRITAEHQDPPWGRGSPDQRSAGATANLALAGPRTVTDAFAGVPGQLAEPEGTGARHSPPGAREAPRQREGSGTGRVLAYGGVFAASLALLLVTTELTSRWQRPSLPASLRRDPMIRAPAPGLAVSEHPGPTPATASPSGAVPSSPAVPLHVPSTRRGREITARTARPDSSRPTGRSPLPGRVARIGLSLSPSPSPSVYPALQDVGVIAAPVKVWDPDSPVPP
ncbi:MAG TPA: protein kinase, partial [Polyangia bacterium]|nr:protein kinase [Polyangia bacterium]